LEEHSLMKDRVLYALKGVHEDWFNDLIPEPNAIVIGETDGGVLEIPSYSLKRRRDILKVLLFVMRAERKLSSLVKMDWSCCREYADFEIILRRAEYYEWDDQALASHLEIIDRGSPIQLIVLGRVKGLLDLRRKFSEAWVIRRLMSQIIDVGVYKTRIALGVSAQQVARDMDWPSFKRREIEKVAATVKMEDLDTIAQRIVEVDTITMKNKKNGLDLIAMKSGLLVRLRS